MWLKSIDDIKVISPWLGPDCFRKTTKRPLQGTKLHFGNLDSPQSHDIEEVEAVEEEDDEKCHTSERETQPKQ